MTNTLVSSGRCAALSSQGTGASSSPACSTLPRGCLPRILLPTSRRSPASAGSGDGHIRAIPPGGCMIWMVACPAYPWACPPIVSSVCIQTGFDQPCQETYLIPTYISLTFNPARVRVATTLPPHDAHTAHARGQYSCPFKLLPLRWSRPQSRTLAEAAILPSFHRHPSRLRRSLYPDSSLP